MEEIMNDKWISIDDAAEYMGVKPVTLRGWIRNGSNIPAHKIGKQWKFKASELDAWVKSGKSALE
jgi:excisionase family DNA binding protein